MNRTIKAAALSLAALVPVMGANAAVEVQPARSAAVKMWPAVDGMTLDRVVELARTLPALTTSPTDPRCDTTARIGTVMREQFAEAPVGDVGEGLRVFASARQGTFTVVMDRADGASCVVASGTGYNTSRKAEIFRSLSALSDRVALR